MTLALIAGEGALPGVLIKRLDAAERPFHLCEIEGHPCEARGDRPITRFRVETLGSFIAELARLGVTEVCFAGRIARPPLDPTAIDAQTMPLVPRMMAALQMGDDAALRVVLGFFEEAGLSVWAAHDIAPELMPAPGILTKTQPEDADRKDAERGIDILAAMAAADVGQACIVSKGQAIALEAAGGTDWMLRSLMTAPDGVGSKLLDNDATWDDPIGIAADWLTGSGQATRQMAFQRDPNLPAGGVLVKAAKPGQDRRIDMPTIGPRTLMRAAEAGLRGIVIEAGGVMVLNPERCIEIADADGLFLWVRA